MRSITIAAPLLMLGYGVARWIDGFDGARHNGPAWPIGHTMFFVAVVLYAVQAVGLARRAADRPTIAWVALTATFAGAFCFLWVITGDLFAGFDLSLPGILNAAGPLLFVLGLVTLLALPAVARRVPFWCPIAFLIGYLAISVDLDLLPLAALVLVVAAVPVARGVFAPPRRELLV
jgi:hypothetical protein